MSETNDKPETTGTETAGTETTQPKARRRRQAATRGAEPSGEPQAPPRRPDADRASGRRATSDVGAARTLVLAIPLYGLAVLCARMAPESARIILLERGWPPHATMALAAVAIAILLAKAVALHRQRRAFALDLLPDVGPRIRPEAAAALVEHVESIRDGRGGRSFLVERVRRVLSQFAARGDVAEASAANDADADADAASVASSFATVKVLVWAMPILGLIGTVIGLSGAVGAFSHAMSGAEQIDAIKDSLREVTTGLAVAFDATFVALVASILVMLPMTWLQKAEDKLVNDVDDYCVTHLLARLDGRSEPAAAAEPAPARAPEAEEIKKVILDAIAGPLSEMLAANARIVERMAEDRKALVGAEGALVKQLSTLGATLQQAAPAMDRAAAELSRATAQVGPTAERAAAEMGRAAAAVQASVARVAEGLGRATAEIGPTLERATGGMERAVTELSRAAAQVDERVAPGVERAAVELGRAVAQLEASTTAADRAATSAERAQDQLCRELGASRQLLSLLAAGLGAGDAPHGKPRHANGANGANGASAGGAALGG